MTKEILFAKILKFVADKGADFISNYLVSKLTQDAPKTISHEEFIRDFRKELPRMLDSMTDIQKELINIEGLVNCELKLFDAILNKFNDIGFLKSQNNYIVGNVYIFINSSYNQMIESSGFKTDINSVVKMLIKKESESYISTLESEFKNNINLLHQENTQHCLNDTVSTNNDELNHIPKYSHLRKKYFADIEEIRKGL